MSYNIGTIRANLKTLLETVSNLTNVYDYYKPDVEGYPSLIFDITENESGFLTNQENMIKITFTAYILVELGVKNMNDAKDILDDTSQAVIDVVNDIDNITLSGSVSWVSPVLGPRTQVETPNGNVMAQQLDIVTNIASSVA